MVIVSCTTTKNQNIVKIPNCIKIDSNLWLDKSDISNSGYRLYTSWVGNLFGENSTEYRSTIPDTSLMDCFNVSGKVYLDYYVRYSDLPVVGLSLKQAMNYTNWRSDRVCEMVLIQNGHLKPNPDVDSLNYFTIKKYVEQSLDWPTEIQYTEIEFPFYRIPSKGDWVIINKALDDEASDFENKSALDTKASSHIRKELIKEKRNFMRALRKSELDKPQAFESSNCQTRLRNVASLYKIRFKNALPEER